MKAYFKEILSQIRSAAYMGGSDEYHKGADYVIDCVERMIIRELPEGWLDAITQVDDIDEILARLEDHTHGQDGKDVTDCRRRLAIVRGRLKGFQKKLLIEMMQDDEKDGLYDVEPKTMKEQLLKIIKEVECENPYSTHNSGHRAWEKACDAIEEKLSDYSPWVSVEDRLPPIGDDVLLMTNGQEKEQVAGRLLKDGRFVMELGYNYGAYDNVSQTVFEVVNVTHWTPLFEPPKAK